MYSMDNSGTGRQRGRPTAEQSTRLKDAICDAAAKTFLKVGFQATTMDMIAETAAVSKPTIYSRFSGKEDLFAAVMCRQMDRLVRFTSVRFGENTIGFEAMLRHEVRVLFEVLQRPDYLAFKRLLQSVAFDLPEMAKEWELGALEPFADRVAAGMRKAAATDDLPDRDPGSWLHLARMFIHATIGWFELEVLAGKVTAKEFDTYASIVIGSITATAHQSEREITCRQGS